MTGKITDATRPYECSGVQKFRSLSQLPESDLLKGDWLLTISLSEISHEKLMLNLPIETNLYLLLLLHCIIGIAAAIIAQKKGLNFPLWLILGLIGGTVALIAALVKQDDQN